MPDLTINTGEGGRVIVQIKKAPGPLSPRLGVDVSAREQLKTMRPEDQEPEIDGTVLYNAEALIAFLTRLTLAGSEARAWVYAPRLPRIYELLGARLGATEISIP
jgi:hypothetical protein